MIELPENLTIRPQGALDGAASGDLLSHVLAQIRLTGDRVSSAVLTPGEPPALEAGAAHVCILTQGALQLVGGSKDPLAIVSGDLVMMPHGPGDMRLLAGEQGAGLALCRFRFAPDSLPGMVATLPQCIHITRAEGAGWLEGIVHFLMIEAGDVQPGAALMVSRLIDLAVIRALRSWVQQGPASGWLGGLADARIAQALRAIHERPMQKWSIEALAGIAGMSRSSFCERFAALVGRSPLRYHNEWRLGLARDLLLRGGTRVGDVGFGIGYESEAAFSRAYKAQYGHSPREEQRMRDEAPR